jgi:hypothetical protein
VIAEIRSGDSAAVMVTRQSVRRVRVSTQGSASAAADLIGAQRVGNRTAGERETPSDWPKVVTAEQGSILCNRVPNRRV